MLAQAVLFIILCWLYVVSDDHSELSFSVHICTIPYSGAGLHGVAQIFSKGEKILQLVRTRHLQDN